MSNENKKSDKVYFIILIILAVLWGLYKALCH
jgi:hypothetical protein